MPHQHGRRHFVRVATESGAHEFAGVGRSHVSHWVGGSVPSGRGPEILCEALTRQLGRPVARTDVGFGAAPAASESLLAWDSDTLVALTDLGRVDVDLERRRVFGAAVYSLAALALPAEDWWAQMARAASYLAAVA